MLDEDPVDSAAATTADPDDNAASSTDQETDALGNEGQPQGDMGSIDTDADEEPGKDADDPDADVIKTENTQKRFDQLTSTIKQRDAQIDRLLQRQPLEFVDKGEPKADDFEDDTEFAAALGEYRSTKATVALINENQQKDSRANEVFDTQQKLDSYNERVPGVVKDTPDFVEVVRAGLLTRTDAQGNLSPAVQAILEADNGPQVAYHIASNPELASSLNHANPIQAAMTVQRLSNQLSAKPSRKPPDTPPIGSEDTGAGAGAADDGLKNIAGATFT